MAELVHRPPTDSQNEGQTRSRKSQNEVSEGKVDRSDSGRAARVTVGEGQALTTAAPRESW